MPKRLALLLTTTATAALLVLQPGSPAYADDCGGIRLSSAPASTEGTTDSPLIGETLPAEGQPDRGQVSTCDTSWGG
ncbi:hypothetical protein ABZ826_28800 [Streptomyces sp. NPDC047515]|uniref:hypothetical protein n=1 Tax=Streptomyces sp. NPDC047515 TaxID=3155380 RepID=UPI0034000AFA